MSSRRRARSQARPERRLHGLTDAELQAQLEAARASTLLALHNKTRPLRREWLRRQAARPRPEAEYETAREVGRLLKAAEQRGATEAPRARGAALGRRNAGRTRRLHPHRALIQAAYTAAREKSWRGVLVQLGKRPGVTIDTGEEQINIGTRVLSFKTLQNIVSQLHRRAR